MSSVGVANCFACGRWARASTELGYDGWWNQIWVTTHCKTCGDITEPTV